MCLSCLTLTFEPEHEFGLRMTFELRPWIKTTFSGRHKGESVFTRSYLPLKHGFHESEKITFSSSKTQKMSSHEARYPWTWVSRPGSKCIFWAPKSTKWANAMSFVFYLDLWPWTRIWFFRITFELWPWIKTITFSGRHKGENAFTWSYELL